MRATKKTGFEGNKMCVSTAELQSLLGCGKASAIEIGNAAKARITIGRRVLWNLSKIQNYLDEAAS